MFDKLGIINDALTRTGNNPVMVEGEGTPEWVVMSPAYESELPYVLSVHDWGFASAFATLERIGASPDPRWSDQHRKPADCLHLAAAMNDAGTPIPFDLLDNTVLSKSSVVTGKYFRRPTPEAWPHMFVESLRQRLMAHAYRGLNEDPVEALRMMKTADVTLAEAKPRTDSEKPRVAKFQSRLLAARLVRRGGYGATR